VVPGEALLLTLALACDNGSPIPAVGAHVAAEDAENHGVAWRPVEAPLPHP
jgi:hypothetical protein